VNQEEEMFKKLFITLTIMAFFFGIQAGRAKADLVVNGGFQTGDFTGWTQSGDTTFSFVVSDTAARTVGGSYAVVGTSALGYPGSISQAINTTAGQAYAVSFWLANDMPGINDFKALWNGVTGKLHLVNANALDWTQYQYTGIASGAVTPISFSFQNDSSAFKFTDVKAAPVPIPGALLLFGPGLAGLAAIRKKLIG
jgi:hypothetical protein